MITRRYIVKGRVQGVGYRYFALREGRRRNLAGWARNLPDGTVEVVAEGEEGLLEELRSSLAQGPPAGRVESVEEQSLELPGSVPPFEIRY